MSKLNVYHHELRHNEYAEFYLKYEADKVIEELKNRIAPNKSDKTLQERLNEVCEKHGVSTLQDLDWAFCESEKRHTKDNIEAAKVIAHHKYKRCLAMASFCENTASLFRIKRSKCRYDEADFADFYYKKSVWLIRWSRKWTELAEHYKEAK